MALPEILESFIGQFYDERTAPGLLLTSEDLPGNALLAEALSLRAGGKVEISMPQRGEKREIMDRALTNAVSSWAGAWLRTAPRRNCWKAWPRS